MLLFHLFLYMDHAMRSGTLTKDTLESKMEDNEKKDHEKRPFT